MQSVDWSAQAKLIERTDGGSEMYFDFRTIRSAGLAELVAQVTAMPNDAAARLLIDAGSVGMLSVTEILALSRRPDFPV